MGRKPPCAVCGCRRYRRTDLGFWVCTAEGHRLEGWVDERADEFQQAGVGREIRRRKLRRDRRGVGLDSDDDLSTGDDGLGRQKYKYQLLAIQFLLQRQLEWISVHLSSASATDLGNCVRDLWLLHVNALAPQESNLELGRIRFMDSIVILYFSIMRTQQSALCLCDLHQLATSGRLPYLGMYGKLPGKIRRRLNESILRFSRSLESLEDLIERAEEMRKRFADRYSIEFRLHSAPLFVAKFCAQLALPNPAAAGWLERVSRLVRLATGKELENGVKDELQLLAWLYICVKMWSQPSAWTPAAMRLHRQRISLQVPHYAASEQLPDECMRFQDQEFAECILAPTVSEEWLTDYRNIISSLTGYYGSDLPSFTFDDDSEFANDFIGQAAVSKASAYRLYSDPSNPVAKEVAAVEEAEKDHSDMNAAQPAFDQCEATMAMLFSSLCGLDPTKFYCNYIRPAEKLIVSLSLE